MYLSNEWASTDLTHSFVFSHVSKFEFQNKKWYSIYPRYQGSGIFDSRTVICIWNLMDLGSTCKSNCQQQCFFREFILNYWVCMLVRLLTPSGGWLRACPSFPILEQSEQFFRLDETFFFLIFSETFHSYHQKLKIKMLNAKRRLRDDKWISVDN